MSESNFIQKLERRVIRKRIFIRNLKPVMQFALFFAGGFLTLSNGGRSGCG